MAAFTPHDLRRSFISELLDSGGDMATVQKLAGYANVQTNGAVRPGRGGKKRTAKLLRMAFAS